MKKISLVTKVDLEMTSFHILDLQLSTVYKYGFPVHFLLNFPLA